jgi:hypothetical protein
LLKKNLLVCLFSTLLVIVPLVDLFSPIHVFSSLENRYLSVRPSVSWHALKDGTFMKDYESYIDDQIVNRDVWMAWKAKMIRLLGLKENNNVLFGKDGYLFEKFLKYSDQYDKNYYHLMEFAMMYPDMKIDFILAPNSYEVLSDLLPHGHLNLNQEKLIVEFYEAIYSTGINGVDILEDLKLNVAYEDKLYYKLDHHWTTFGAYVAYSAYCEAIGITPITLDDLEYVVVQNFFGSLASAAKLSDAVGDSIKVYDIPYVSVYIDGIQAEGLYDFDYIDKRDKYGLFLHNNPGQMTVFSNHPLASDEKIIVFKDSYANSFVPFLSVHYKEIEVIDLRYFKGSIDNLMKTNDYNRVLFLYNAINFTKDTSIIKLNN